MSTFAGRSRPWDLGYRWRARPRVCRYSLAEGPEVDIDWVDWRGVLGGRHDRVNCLSILAVNVTLIRSLLILHNDAHGAEYVE